MSAQLQCSAVNGVMMKIGILAVLFSAATAFAQGTVAAPVASPCTKLAKLVVKNVTVDSAIVVASGSFTQPGATKPSPRAAKIYSEMPQMCRVIAHSHPRPDSDIVIEVWLPTSG